MQTFQELGGGGGGSCHICSLQPWNRRAGRRGRTHTLFLSTPGENVARRSSRCLQVIVDPPPPPIRHPASALRPTHPPTASPPLSDRRTHAQTLQASARPPRQRGLHRPHLQRLRRWATGKKVLLSRPVSLPTTGRPVHHVPSPYLGPEVPGACWSSPHCSQLEGAHLQRARSSGAPPRPHGYLPSGKAGASR